MVNGPADTYVPVITDIVMATHVDLSNKYNDAGAEFAIVNSQNQTTLQSIHVGNGQFFEGVFTTYVPSDQLIGVLLYAYSISVSDQLFRYSFDSAMVDPSFMIDPAFLTENPSFSLQFSPGVGNSPPSGVPEPAAWVTILVGVGYVGAGLRMRMRRTDAMI